MKSVRNNSVAIKILIISFMILLQSVVAFSQENSSIQVFEVRKKLQMTSTDPIVRDYYVNAGQAMGLKTGAVVNVYRKVPLNDPYKQQTQSHVELPVGVMKIIYSDQTMAIGRIQSIVSTNSSPVLEGDVFMVGDRIDMGTINFEKSDAATAAPSTSPVEATPAAPPKEEPVKVSSEKRTTASEVRPEVAKKPVDIITK